MTARHAQKRLTLDFLNEFGHAELEFILMHLNKQLNISFTYILVHLTALLMVILKPSECFFVVETLVKRSWGIFQANNQDKMRWHCSPNLFNFNKLISTFVSIYLKSKKIGQKKGLIKHFMAIKYDMTELVDRSFRSFLTDFLTLEHSLDFMMVFLCEGVKSMVRYTYAIIKCHKEFLITYEDPTTVLTKLRYMSLTYTESH